MASKCYGTACKLTASTILIIRSQMSPVHAPFGPKIFAWTHEQLELVEKRLEKAIMTDTTDVVSVVPEGPKGMQTCGEKLSDLSLMCIMPFLAWFVTGYAYASVGLHYRENSWAIWHMGVLTFLAYLVRPVVSLIISRVGPWMARPCH